MKARWLSRRLTYDGTQLRPHWILRTCRIEGDAVVGFRGPCALAAGEIADLEDLLAGAVIAGDDMVHFVAERFDDGDLERAVLWQRLFAARALDVIRELASAPARRRPLRREGDDLFYGRGKLSISVATRSPVSTLVHFAVNVTDAGTPVRTASLEMLGIEPSRFGRTLLERTAAEAASIVRARCKVRARMEP